MGKETSEIRRHYGESPKPRSSARCISDHATLGSDRSDLPAGGGAYDDSGEGEGTGSIMAPARLFRRVLFALTLAIAMRGSDDMTRRTKDRGTDNVLADLAFPDAEELTAKAILAKKINDIVLGRGLTQVEIADLLGMPQPKVSCIRSYKLRGISLERLMQALTALGQHVEIVVTASTKKVPPRIDVAA
jgi:predicted XRE-type DNA-binding protein